MSSFALSPTLEQEDSERALTFCVSYGFLAGVLLAGTFRTQVTRLETTDEGLLAMGYLGGYKPGMLRMEWARVRELHFAPSGKGEVGGLYAREGEWCSRCILPRIGETQCDQVTAAIFARFPQAKAMAARPAGKVGLEAVAGRLRAAQWSAPIAERGDAGRFARTR